MNRKLALGFAAWRERIFGVVDDPMAKAMRYFLNRNLARGWEGWQAIWEAQKAKLESMRRSMSHMLNRELARGFGAWFEMSIARKAFLEKLRHGLRFMLNRQLARGMVGWQRSVQSSSSMAKGLGHMLHREQSRGWRAWHMGQLCAEMAQTLPTSEMVHVRPHRTG